MIEVPANAYPVVEAPVDPTEVDAVILKVAAARGMVLTISQLEAAGISRFQVHRRLGRLLTQVTDGVYAVGAMTNEVRLRAALAALPQAVVSHGTAAGYLGLPLPASDDISVLLCGRRTRRRIEGVEIHLTRWLPLADVTSVDGLPMTSVARTICDLSVRYPVRRLRHLAEHAVVERLATAAELQACILGWRRQGRPGSAVLRRLEQLLLDDEPVPPSELERRAVALFRRGRLPAWVSQYRPPWYDGVRGVVDIAWPEFRVVVELDGRRWHATTQAHVEDRRRDRLAAQHGWLTLRFGWQEIVERPDAVIEECRAMLASRRRAAS